MVVVDQPLIPKVPFVGINDRKAARACAQHLKDLGLRSFAIVTFQLGTDGTAVLLTKTIKRNLF